MNKIGRSKLTINSIQCSMTYSLMDHMEFYATGYNTAYERMSAELFNSIPKAMPELLAHKPELPKLNEKDLFPWYWLLDAWMFFYYLLFSTALFRTAKKTWK